MFTRDDNQIYKSYLGLLLEQQQEEVKQQLAQQLQQPKVQQAMKKQAEELYAKYQNEIAAAKEQDGGTPGSNVEALLKKIQTELDAAAKQRVNDSVELEEGFFGRTASLASGAAKKFGDVMSGKNTTTSFRQEAILKHFEKLKHNLGSSLRELQRDMETTSGTDTKVKDFVKQTITNIEAQHNIAPVQSKLSDFRHKAGQLVKNVATGAIFAIPVMAVAAPIAAAIGLTGAAAAAVAAGLTGGAVSMLKDMVNGQQPDAKRAVITGLGAAVTAGLVSNFNAPDAQIDAPSADVPTDTVPHGDVHDLNVDDEIKNFKSSTGTDFSGGPMNKAAADIVASMKDAGLTDYGSTFGARNLMRDLGHDFAKYATRLKIPHEKLAEIIKDVTENLTPEQLAQVTNDQALRNGKAAIEFTQIIAKQYPELADKGIMDIAKQTVATFRKH